MSPSPLKRSLRGGGPAPATPVVDPVGVAELPFLNTNLKIKSTYSYSVFQGFSLAKFAYGGSILSSSQFLILPQLPQKMKLKSKVVKIDPKITVLLPMI
jgi:hypothetical protein